MRLKTATASTQDSSVLQVIHANGIDVSLADGTGPDAELTIGLSSQGTFYYVDTANGNDTSDGRSWDNAFATMGAAFDVLASGDTVFFHGKLKEQLTTPVQVFDVSIIGASNRPRHADSTPDGGQSGASWQLPDAPAAATPLVKVLQQGWLFSNFVMAGPTDSSCALLYRDGGAGNAERDASHAEFHNVRFASGQDGIEQSGGCYNVGIFDCSFHDLTGYALKHTAGAGIANPYRWQIKRNRFQGCANLMGTWNTHQFEFVDNVVGEITTNYFDVSGGSGHNVFKNNAFDIAAADFDPTGHVKGHSTDVWSNTLKDAIETGLPAD